MDTHTAELTAQAAPPESTEDLVAEALACVAWDGTVDMHGLASIEFAHDEAAMRRVVAGLIDSFECASNGIVVGGSDILIIEGDEHGFWGVDPFVVRRRATEWRIDAVGLRTTITDDHLVLYGTLCARHKCFSTSWAPMNMGFAHRRSPSDVDWWIEWRDMWMSRIINALATASGAWTGKGVMRTQYLARALLGLLQARNAGGPLASPVDDASQKETLGPASSIAAAVRLREAIAIVEGMPQGVRFPGKPLRAAKATTYDANNAVESLKFIINATQRIYETPPFYTAVIAPAEYQALCQNAPADVFQ